MNTSALYARWIALLARHRLLLTILLILQAIVFSSLSAGIRWQADVLAFFSAGSADVAAMRKAAESTGVAAQLRIDLHTRAGAPSWKPEVIAAAHDLADKLRATTLFHQVWTGVDTAALASSYGNLLAQTPLLLTDADRAAIDARMSPDALTTRFQQVRNHLADPDGELLARQLQSDPLALSSLLTDRLKSLSPDTAAPTTFDDGVLLTQDKAGAWHAMIVADPRAVPSDARASETLLAAVTQALTQTTAAHPTLDAWTVGAHRGYTDNAHRVKADVALISALGSLAVAAAIALYFRRLAPALLCFIPPTVGVGLTLGLAGLAHIELPLILLGFAGLLCGSTTDYGIQIIAECRRLARPQGRWSPDIPSAAAANLLGPISMSVATSVTGFAALGLSDAPGLRALGLFVAAATLTIWLITFALLPATLGPWILHKHLPENSKLDTRNSKLPTALRWGGSLAFLALTLLSLLPAARVRFNPDPRALDGSSAQLRADESHFYDVWGDIRNRAIVLVSAPTAADALAAQSRITDYLADQLRDHRISGVTTAAPLLPDPKTARANLAAWQSFWTPDRQSTLRQNLTAAARAANFSPNVFTAYADKLTTTALPTPEEQLANSPAALFPGFITRTHSTITLATIVQMNSPNDTSLRLATAWAPELRLRFSNLDIAPPTILSGNVLLFDATQRARAEGERFAPWCLLAILLPLWLYFRNLRRAWLALLCLLVGFLWVLAAAHLFASDLNLLSLVPLLFTLGVAVDYGIYTATSGGATTQDSGLTTQDSRLPATFLCALTTILGSGSLILAQHPALRWLGITLVAGVSGGYLASLFLVAPLTRYSANAPARNAARTPFHRRMATLARLSLSALLLLLTLLLLIPPFTEYQLHQERPATLTPPPTTPLRQLAPRTFTVGPSWMRYHNAPNPADPGLWEIALTGSPSARGRAVGLLANPLDFRIESEMLDQLDTLLPQEWARFLILRSMSANLLSLPKYIPLDDQQEIYSAATAYDDPHAYLAPPYPRILSYHALHDVSQMLIDNPLIVPNSFACTGIISTPDYSASSNGHLLLARNFDFEGGESFARQKSLTYIIPPPGEGIPFAHVAWPGLDGCVTGINRERIALFINAAATSDFARIGTPTILMTRQILQHASSLDDAEKIIRNTPVFVSDIIVVADGKTGQARVFEKSPAHTDAYTVTDSAAVANHLTTKTFANDNTNRSRIEDSTTMQRYTRARELLTRLEHRVTPESLAALLRDKKGPGDTDLGFGNRNAIDGLIACHAVIIDATSGQLWVAGYPNAEGAFLGIDILATLDHAPDHPDFHADASPPIIPPDNIMTDGTWQRIQDGRRYAEASAAALKRHDAQAAIASADLAIAANPNFYLGHELKGRALLQSGARDLAKSELQQALAADPPYASRRAALKELITQCDTK